MAAKYDWRIQEKAIYGSGVKPQIITLLPRKFLEISGRGDPNTVEFSEKVSALMSLSYAVRFLPKKGIMPVGYFDYGVYPLEGIWGLTAAGIKEQAEQKQLNKTQFEYTLMVGQPDFVTDEVAQAAMGIAQKKEPNSLYSEIHLVEREEGLAAQILHIGPFDTEPVSFAVLSEFLKINGYQQRELRHKEIYLQDARKTDPQQLHTLLRYWIQRKETNGAAPCL